jgi:hypothetical protein
MTGVGIISNGLLGNDLLLKSFTEARDLFLLSRLGYLMFPGNPFAFPFGGDAELLANLQKLLLAHAVSAYDVVDRDMMSLGDGPERITFTDSMSFRCTCACC